MSIKISFMHFMKWTRVMLPKVFQEFELVYVMFLFFSFHDHCQLVKDQLQQKSVGATAPPAPPPLSQFLRTCYWNILYAVFLLRHWIKIQVNLIRCNNSMFFLPENFLKAVENGFLQVKSVFVSWSITKFGLFLLILS